MNRRQILLNEIRAVLTPKQEQEHFIQHRPDGLFYKFDDYDLSVCQPRPGATGKRMTRGGQVCIIGDAKVYF